MNKIKNVDQQLTNLQKKFNKEIPERVGLVFYTNYVGDVEIEVHMTDENMWMSQQIMSNLLGAEEHTIIHCSRNVPQFFVHRYKQTINI